jgi:hypothetical protein
MPDISHTTAVEDFLHLPKYMRPADIGWRQAKSCQRIELIGAPLYRRIGDFYVPVSGHCVNGGVTVPTSKLDEAHLLKGVAFSVLRGTERILGINKHCWEPLFHEHIWTLDDHDSITRQSDFIDGRIKEMLYSPYALINFVLGYWNITKLTLEDALRLGQATLDLEFEDE